MIDALIQGKLHAKAQQRTGKAGRPFVTAKVTTTAKDGAQQFVNVIAFAPDACNALLALGAGDAVALGTWAHALQVKRRIRRRPVLGRWWCAVLGLPLGLHSASLSGDVVGRQHGMGNQV